MIPPKNEVLVCVFYIPLSHTYLDFYIKKNNLVFYRERIKKLEEENRNLRKKYKKLEERVYHLEKDLKSRSESDSQSTSIEPEILKPLIRTSPVPVTNEVAETSSGSTAESGLDGTGGILDAEQVAPVPSLSDLEDSIKNMSGDRLILKYLSMKLFTTNELINCTRTGKKTIKSKEVKPALNQQKFNMLKQLVLKKTTYDTLTFFKKIENIQKCAIRDNINK